jgi:hypothetical protein
MYQQATLLTHRSVGLTLVMGVKIEAALLSRETAVMLYRTSAVECLLGGALRRASVSIPLKIPSPALANFRFDIRRQLIAVCLVIALFAEVAVDRGCDRSEAFKAK